MAKENAKPEGPADVGEPAEEGGRVRPEENPRRRNMSGRFPGEANRRREDEAPKPTGTRTEQERAQRKEQVRQETQYQPSEGRH